MVTPVKVIKELHGFTRPQIIQFDTENQYVVKFQHYLGGSKYLVREYVVGKLAQELNLPIVPFHTIHIPKSFIRRNGRLIKHRFKHGTQFCSKYLRDCINLTNSPPVPSKIINSDVGLQLFVFDLWVGNKDRHMNNILLEKADNDQYYIHIIDHTHTFSKIDYQNLKMNKKQVHKWLLSLSDDQDVIFNFIKKIEQLPKDKIDKILESVPQDWKLRQQKKNAIMDYLEKSKEHLAVNISTILQY